MAKAAELHSLPRTASDTRIRVERSGKAAFKLADPTILPMRQIPLAIPNPDMPKHLPYLCTKHYDIDKENQQIHLEYEY